MATMSPVNSHMEGHHDHPLDTSAYGSSESLGGTKSPRYVNLGFLKNLAERKTTREGQTPKRRGPKPDSKPALTRRQELNRQAQRTHRERKEVYIKALEEEVMRLKESFTMEVQSKTSVAKENRRLKELLQAHGIAYQSQTLYPPDHFTSKGTSTYGGSSFSGSGSQIPGPSLSPATTSASDLNSPSLAVEVKSEYQGTPQNAQLHDGLDHDQIGIDFVLTLEKACSDHQQFLCIRSQQEPAPTISGHALMATCPPRSHIMNSPDEQYPHKTWDIPDPELMKLFDLSQNLPLDGEITPIIALQIVRNHERFGELSLQDFEALKENLRGKSRCYGFGAVLEEFEVQDALNAIFANKTNEFSAFSGW